MEFTLEYIRKENKYYKFFVLTEDDNIKACKPYQNMQKEMNKFYLVVKYKIYIIVTIHTKIDNLSLSICFYGSIFKR